MRIAADESFVAGPNLFPDESEFTPRPAWLVIEAARRQGLSGELTLQTTPATRIYLRDGEVYFAERSTDGTLAIRLLVEGVINREQMQRGTVIVNGVEHVGRMFDADPSIDRVSVELCAELFTDDVMVDVANRNVQSYEMVLYKRHPSGIDRWYPAGSRQSEAPSNEPAPAQTTPQPTAAALPKPAIAPMPEPMPEPKSSFSTPPLTLQIPVTKPANTSTPTPPPPAVTQQLPITPFVSSIPPLTKLADPKPTLQMPIIPPIPVGGDGDASTIADEVAEAIKRAFSGLGA